MKKTNFIYLSLLKQLKHEISLIEKLKTKKKWKPYQKIVIDYINGASKYAIYEHNNEKIILADGDPKKGFIHILLGHYKKNELEAMDIVNIFEIFIRGIKLESEGVSNPNLTVYMKLQDQKDLRLVLNKKSDKSWVVSAYRKN